MRVNSKFSGIAAAPRKTCRYLCQLSDDSPTNVDDRIKGVKLPHALSLRHQKPEIRKRKLLPPARPVD